MRLALEAAEIGIWEYDLVTERLIWDDRVRHVAEVGPDDVPTWTGHFIPAVHPDDRDAVGLAFANLVAGDSEARLTIECRIVGQITGRTTWAAIEGRLLTGENGGRRVIGTARDITAQHAAHEALERLNGELEHRVSRAVAERQIWVDMFEGSDDPVAAIDSGFRLIAMNGAYRSQFRRLFGSELSIGDDLLEALAHMPAVRGVAEYLWRRALGGDVVDIPRSAEAGGDGAYFDIKFRPLHNRDGAAIGAFQYSRNVTPRVIAQNRLRETQAALVRAQKMEALGQLTGGIAHDFNNLLQVVGGNLHLVKKMVAGNQRAEERVENALAGITRGARLASQLLAFGRRQPLEPRVVNLGRFVADMDDMLRRALGEAVELETVVSGGLWNALVDPGQIESAILNLAINARDAMDGRGRLTVEANNAALDDAYAEKHEDVKAGQYVVLAVTDTGCGMSADVVERAFEPFYTTKAEGKGTGLGLSMVYGLVKQSGGHVKIYSEVGAGTTIKIYLPRVFESEDAVAERASGPIVGGVETILVVEDDADVRETTVALLAELGYQVLKASEATSALAVIESGLAIDLLFTDVVMPGPLSSTELARKAKDRLPNLAVLFTSGYTHNAIVHGGRLDAGIELLSKPYTSEALARKVRHLLRNQAQRAVPATRGDAAPEPADAPSPEPAASGGLGILLVEDDELIRGVTGTMLEELGHQVLEAEDAQSAWSLLTSNPVDVLVVDRGLPGISGDELAHRAVHRQPHLGVIFATGAAAAIPDADLSGAVFLIKPYTAEDLRRALAQFEARSQDQQTAGEDDLHN